ncbi:hypothetical protein MVES1_002110 [Malassezia vespertilionis]|uniref:uncharacterized protein n=1 Tax=Malassezia vespertilionis TaxID=2020962 RepID=UPI0024B153E1|nr:uncharacterized protein MVES1_002110 [Malassezia vespertilionis]WFD06756.1 hypothetical protein MVES1_002110 [Malassezia vespertilionis]
MAARKVLVVGPPDGNLRELVAKTSAIAAKHGPFAATFIVGDLFASTWSDEAQALLDGALTLPMKTYFYYGTRPLPAQVAAKIPGQGNEPIALNDQLYYMGSNGILEIDGFRVAFLGGSCTDLDLAPRLERMPPGFNSYTTLDTPEDVAAGLQTLLENPALVLGKAVPPLPLNNAGSLQEARALSAAQNSYTEQLAHDATALGERRAIDFLFCNAWPRNVERLASTPLPDPNAPAWGTEAVTHLAEAARPRYFFARAPSEQEARARALTIAPSVLACGAFWEREPYENPPFAAITPPFLPPVTRFLSLAKVANAEKAQWFMALCIVPADTLLKGDTASAALQRPANLTQSPLLAPAAPPKQSAEPLHARWDAAPNATKRRKHKHSREPVAPVGPERCWFCLSNPNVEKHLIVCIGNESYIALPKGQVPIASDASSPVPGGGHALVIPIAHMPSIYAPDTASAALYNEIDAFKLALRKCYAAYEAVPVFWTVVRRSGVRAGHTQIQAVPVRRDRMDGIESYFRGAAQDQGLAYEDAEVAEAFATPMQPSELVRATDRDDFCMMELDHVRLLILLRGERFNLQFPRETLTSFLGMPERAQWKACERPEEVEAAEADAFKEALQEFTDPILDA